MVLLKGADVNAAIAAKAKTADTEIKPALLLTLARRGDKASLPIFVAAAEDANEAVASEALRGLGMLGDASAVPLLLKLAATSGNVQSMARTSLVVLKGEDVDNALMAAMAQEPKIRLEVVHALEGRRVVAATPALLKSAEDADGGVRGESLKALGAVAPADALPAVTALLVKAPDDAARSEAANALRASPRESDPDKRAEPMLNALQSASGPARLALIGVLGRLGGAKPLEAVRTAVKDSDAKIKDAAIRALADWPDAAAAPDLLAIAQNSTEQTQQVLALRGYVRVVRLESRRSPAETAKMLIAALEVAKRPDEKRQVIGGLAETRDIAALQAVAPFLSDATLSGEAANAAVRIGRDIVNNQPAAVKAAMEQVLDVTKNADLQKQAKETLDRAEQRIKEMAPKK